MMLPTFLAGTLVLALAPAVKQNISAPPEPTLSLGQTLEATARSAKREECKLASERDCTFSGLVLDAAAAGSCSDPVMPVERYRVGRERIYGVVLRASIRLAGSATNQIEKPILFLVRDDRVQQICVAESTPIGAARLEVRLIPWERMSSAELSQLPDAKDTNQRKPAGGFMAGVMPAGARRNLPIIEAPGIIDWIFNSGRRDPVKLRISSDPVGGIVFVGNRLIGKTDQEFGIAPANVRNIVVLLKGRRIPISRCQQRASDAWVRVWCSEPPPSR